jgi:putative flavoprotein involved in K+ transport
MVDYFVAYTERIPAPVRCGIAVTLLHKQSGGIGFHAETSKGVIEANNVVAVTGPFQRPVIPDVVPPETGPPETGIAQMNSSGYRNPGQLPRGAVLVVGAGSSGAQIADELSRAGRRVYLSVGRHGRPPRRYRGRDFAWWFGVQGMWQAPVSDPPQRHATIAISGAYGGHTIDYRRLAARGVVLLGRAEAFGDGVMRFCSDLASNLAHGDASYLSLLDAADAHTVREGLDLPREPAARTVEPDPPCVTEHPTAKPSRRRNNPYRLRDRVRARFWLADGRRLQRTR